MIRLIKNITILFLCGILFYIGTLIADKQYLRDEILYIRIVYDSSIGIDQTDKSLLRNVFTSELSDIVFSEISFAEKPSCFSFKSSPSGPVFCLILLLFPELFAIASHIPEKYHVQ